MQPQENGFASFSSLSRNWSKNSYALVQKVKSLPKRKITFYQKDFNLLSKDRPLLP